ncbi:MAG: hypothetical protein F6K04_14935 [Leptolyngbya sp. SIO4C5]|nr:hypothetical protein [Leptolyngbya sp. SIO4C5]
MAKVVKATLTPWEKGKAAEIKFMFNPKELAFENTVETSSNPGARSQRTGKQKVNFSNIPPKKITISNILFDTYESGKDVFEEHIKDLQAAVHFVSEEQKEQKPPVYTFTWGKTYLDYCFIEKLNYKLTKFLADGTPVRAVIDSLTLVETDRPDNSSSSPSAKPTPKTDNQKSRKQKR